MRSCQYDTQCVLTMFPRQPGDVLRHSNAGHAPVQAGRSMGLSLQCAKQYTEQHQGHVGKQEAHLLTSKKRRAPPVPSLCADVPVRMSDSSGLKQQPVSECVVLKPENACTGVFSLRRSHSCSNTRPSVACPGRGAMNSASNA